MALYKHRSRDDSSFLTVDQAARLLGVSESTARNYCKKDLLPGAYQDWENGPWHIPSESVANLIENLSYARAKSSKKPGPPSAWERFRFHPIVFYLARSVLAISVLLGIIAAGISIPGSWDDVFQLAKEKGLILAFPKAKEDEILIMISEFQYSENLVNTEAHNEIRYAIEEAAHNLGDSSIRVQVHPAKLDADDFENVLKIAKLHRASLVIWGEDTGAHITVNFLNVKNPYYIPSTVRISEKEKTQLADPKAYAQFVTDDLPGQLRFLSLLAVGQTHYSAGESSLAITTFEEAISTYENQQPLSEVLPDAYFFLGSIYQDQIFDLDQSIDFYNKAIQIDPNYVSAYNNRGNVWVDKGDLEKALADFNKAIQLDPNYLAAYNNRGIAWSEKGDFEKAIQLDPHIAAPYFNLGVEWRDKGNLEKALGDFTEAIQLDPNFALAYNERGTVWSDKGDFDKAIDDFNEAIRLDPNFFGTYQNRGLTWFLKEDLEKAIADYDKAIEFNPDYPSLYSYRAFALFVKGDFEKAIADYDKVIQLDPQNVEAYNIRGFIWSEIGDLEKAIADYDKAIQLDPQNAEAYDGRGIIWMMKGNMEKAIADYNKAIQLDPNFTQTYYNRGAALRVKGNLDQALIDFDKVIQLDSQDADAFLSRGEILRELGDLKSAISDFRRYLELRPDAEDREKVEQWISELEKQIP